MATIYFPSINHTDVVEPAMVREAVGLGVGVPRQTLPDPQGALDLLQPDCWMDWHYDRIGETGYMPCMYGRLSPAMEVLMLEHPGKLWLGPNEPDVAGQADMTPAQAATAVRAAQDLGVRMTCPAVMVTPYREYGLHWLDEYMRLGGPMEHAFNVHLYGVETPAQWCGLLDGVYRWLEKRRLDLAVVVSETNADHGDERMCARMLMGIQDRLATDAQLQAVLWFSARWDRHREANLVDDEGLTALGRAFVG